MKKGYEMESLVNDIFFAMSQAPSEGQNDGSFQMKLFMLILFAGFLYWVIKQSPKSEKSRESEEISEHKLVSRAHKSVSFEYKSGQDSGWVVLYQIAGWLGLIGGLVWFMGSNWAIGVYSILVASSAFFAAHVLRLMEKTAHNSEQQTELLQKLVENR